MRFFAQIKRIEKRNQSKTTKSLPTKDQIPRDPQLFYQDIGFITHPKTGKPVTRLTSYQEEVWRAGLRGHKYRLVIKSQKVGLSTSVLLEDFQHAITDCQGYDILIIAQTIPQAREHLYTLRQIILNSNKYSNYLITHPTQLIMKDQVTKVTVLYIRNPDSDLKPTRIIGLGTSEASIWSWKNVKHIHISDIAVSQKVDYSNVINAAMTRLANTEGSMIIETPPRGPFGKVYDIYRQSKIEPNRKTVEGQFWVTTIQAREAVEAGVMTNEFLEGEREHLGAQFAMYYEAEFSSITGDVFDPILVNKSQTESYDPEDICPDCPKVMGIDAAFGSNSSFGITILQLREGKIQVLFAEDFQRQDFPVILDKIWHLIDRYSYINKIIVDASNADVITRLKIELGEPPDWIEDKKQLKSSYNTNTFDRLRRVIPIAFGSEAGRNLLSITKGRIESGNVVIHPQFKKLITALNTATATNGKIDKTVTAYNDVLDSFMLACYYYKPRPKVGDNI